MKRDQFDKAAGLFHRVSELEVRIASLSGADAGFQVRADEITAEQYKLLRAQYMALLSSMRVDVQEQIAAL